MNVVFDTNVLVSAFAVRGLCYEIFFASIDRFKLVTSGYILREFEQILLKKFHVPREKVVDAVGFVKDHALCVVPRDIEIRGLTDHKDALVVGTALAVSAAYLISGDKALLSLKRVEDTAIISPRDFLLAMTRID